MTTARVYIAGPMTGLPEFNYPAFNAAAAAWRAAGWDAINPADCFGGAQNRPYREYVASDLAVLRTCHAIAMLPGWDAPSSRGSVWEREIAVSILWIPVYDAMEPFACAEFVAEIDVRHMHRPRPSGPLVSMQADAAVREGVDVAALAARYANLPASDRVDILSALAILSTEDYAAHRDAPTASDKQTTMARIDRAALSIAIAKGRVRQLADAVDARYREIRMEVPHA